jgi:TolB-like protein
MMRLYAGSGRRSAAIQLYRTLADAMKADLGAQPEAETRALFAEITRGGEEQPLAPSPAATTIPASPQSLSWPPTADHPGDEGLIQRRVTRRNWILAGGLTAAVMAAFLLYEFATTTTQQPAGVDAAKTVSSSPASAISIAVLPFANLSGDASQEFFSDGLTEEITTALAKIRNLRVVGRTSAYQFKDERKDLRAIGQALSATHLIEGSVRKAGDRVRIAVQLVRADDGTHVWTENYDRQLTDIFAIQEDIATAITGALRVPLGLAPGETVVSNRDIDPESYQQYLRARALLAQRGPGVGSAIEILEPLVARNANYAPAWAQLAWAYSLAPIYHPARFGSSIEASRRAVNELLGKAEAAAQRAVQVDPGAVAYAPLGYLQFVRGKLLLAEDWDRQALALDPNGPALQGLSLLLATVGRLKEAIALKQQLQALEPFVPLFNRTRGLWLWADGQTDAAITILKNLPDDGGVGDLAMIYASLGRYAEAADLLESPPGAFSKDVARLKAFSKDVARLLRTAPAKAAAPQSIPSDRNLDWVYLHVGAPERALESYERDVQNGWSGGIFLPLVWHSSFAPVRKTERFKAFARNAGLVDYWRAKGWPQWCHPTTGEDFACD